MPLITKVKFKLCLHNVVVSAAFFAVAVSVSAADTNAPTIRELADGYVPSSECRECHEKNFASWHHTFHRTMTQAATREAVLGDFTTNNTLTYLGVKAEMVRTTNGFAMRLQDQQGKMQQLAIDRVVGSHRIQQYLTRDGTRYVRLPVAYDLMQHRWMHLNGSFFHPDGDDYRQPVVEWNSNCIFCHNVKAQPGYDWTQKTWNSRVAELGIACGACHGPGQEHIAAARSPESQAHWAAAKSGEADTHIINPAHLDSDRAMQICGHCHGQRVPEPIDRIREIMSAGDPYDAGKNLREFFKPVQRDTKVGPESFASRFWADGSPRLSAYEYQGLLRSKCLVAGEPGKRITCITCHSMHGGDVNGQITEANRGNIACLSCHQQFSVPAALVAHTQHQSGPGAPLCYDCHMPRIVYGVMSPLRTHDISIPRPQDTVTFGKPNACNQCHLDQSVNWAIGQTRRLWPKEFSAAKRSEDSQFDSPEGARALFAGDALVRGLTAAALNPTAAGRMKPAFATPLLLEALRDNYPIVRYFAANSLEQINPQLPKPDYLGTTAGRALAIARWKATLDPSSQTNAAALANQLGLKKVNVDISVGE